PSVRQPGERSSPLIARNSAWPRTRSPEGLHAPPSTRPSRICWTSSVPPSSASTSASLPQRCSPACGGAAPKYFPPRRVDEARWLEARGVDAVIAQGIEAGGHRGMFLLEDLNTQVGTLALVP